MSHSIENIFLPFGFTSIQNITGFSRIMSGFGAVIYEMGVIGIVLIAALIYIIIKAKYHQNHFVNAIFILILMFSAVQLASPLFSLYIGYCIYSENKRAFHINDATEATSAFLVKFKWNRAMFKSF